jgi:hypothetical protein
MARKKVANLAKAEESAVVELPDLKPFETFQTAVVDLSVLHTDDAPGDAAIASLRASTSMAQDADFSDELTPVPSEEEEEVKPKRTPKARKPRAPKPEPVYEIPEVEKKVLSHAKGVRYGYACLNTVLRNKKPAKDSIFCSRTLRLDTLKKNGADFMKELGRQNIKDLIKLIEWNEENKIRFMRLSSEMCVSLFGMAQ